MLSQNLQCWHINSDKFPFHLLWLIMNFLLVLLLWDIMCLLTHHVLDESCEMYNIYTASHILGMWDIIVVIQSHYDVIVVPVSTVYNNYHYLVCQCICYTELQLLWIKWKLIQIEADRKSQCWCLRGKINDFRVL